MKVHLIAIGGSAMHNMALALNDNGFEVSGSDDAIFNPSRDRLRDKGLLPDELGWFPHKIDKTLDAIILGMHATPDNPELLKAKQLNIPIFSYPEYIFEQSKDKHRVVIAGSHGKTSITSMVLHVLKYHQINCDYMVGAQVDGFDNMVQLSDDNKVIILEGDEYLSSPIDRRPKFHLYKPHLAVISGIAWDHINVFPTFENYLDQFRIFKNSIQDCLIYCSDDPQIVALVNEDNNCRLMPYGIHPHLIKKGITYLETENNTIPISIFGNHNLQNINAAKLVCHELGVLEDDFFQAITTFKGAEKRLELVVELETCNVYKDFAHSPSKLKATISAVKQQFQNRSLVACMELHTFSSLNKDFLSEYRGSMNLADIAIIYIDPESNRKKNSGEGINQDDILQGFDRDDLLIFNDKEMLNQHLSSLLWNDQNLLMMSSGNFNGINIEGLIKK